MSQTFTEISIPSREEFIINAKFSDGLAEKSKGYLAGNKARFQVGIIQASPHTSNSFVRRSEFATYRPLELSFTTIEAKIVECVNMRCDAIYILFDSATDMTWRLEKMLGHFTLDCDGTSFREASQINKTKRIPIIYYYKRRNIQKASQMNTSWDQYLIPAFNIYLMYNQIKTDLVTHFYFTNTGNINHPNEVRDIANKDFQWFLTHDDRIFMEKVDEHPNKDFYPSILNKPHPIGFGQHALDTILQYRLFKSLTAEHGIATIRQRVSWFSLIESHFFYFKKPISYCSISFFNEVMSLKQRYESLKKNYETQNKEMHYVKAAYKALIEKYQIGKHNLESIYKPQLNFED